MEEGFGGLVPIWGWSPMLVYLFLLGIDFGAILAIRIVIERRFYLTKWWSYKIGDTIGLPVYGAFAAIVVSDVNHPDAFYTQTWWQWFVLGVGVALSLLIQLRAYLTGSYSKQVVFNPSEMYHMVIYGLMFYFIASSVFPLVHGHQPLWATIGAFVGLAIWVVCVVIDSTPLQDLSPERNRKAFWELF